MARRSLIAIDSETWAGSGGTGGMFAKLWRQGRLDIVSRELTPVEQQTLEQAVAVNFAKPTTVTDRKRWSV